MPSSRLSVIIPTYKRGTILRECLKHLHAQTVAKDLEIIVVSDGHDAETAAAAKAYAGVTFLQIPKTQQGVARNRGLEHASAPIVLFIGDDIFLAPDACEKHLAAHAACHGSTPLTTTQKVSFRAESRDIAVLGFTTWDPALTITPVMRWLEATGWQFGYPFLEPYRNGIVPAEMQHKFTYTSHISVPTVVAKRTPFREDVTLYGWEDIEWGLRLKKAGVGLWYAPDAHAFHHHPISMEQSLKRMEELGTSAVFLTKVAPELDRLPYGFKRFAYHILALLPTMRGKHAKAFLAGITKAEKGA